jgi:hypothetical protein
MPYLPSGPAKFEMMRRNIDVTVEEYFDEHEKDDERMANCGVRGAARLPRFCIKFFTAGDQSADG